MGSKVNRESQEATIVFPSADNNYQDFVQKMPYLNGDRFCGIVASMNPQRLGGATTFIKK
jgi:hypothetical protein